MKQNLRRISLLFIFAVMVLVVGCRAGAPVKVPNVKSRIDVDQNNETQITDTQTAKTMVKFAEQFCTALLNSDEELLFKGIHPEHIAYSEREDAKIGPPLSLTFAALKDWKSPIVKCTVEEWDIAECYDTTIEHNKIMGIPIDKCSYILFQLTDDGDMNDTATLEVVLINGIWYVNDIYGGEIWGFMGF